MRRCSAAREVEGEKETKKRTTGGSEVERDLVPVWQMCFSYTSSRRFTIAQEYL